MKNINGIPKQVVEWLTDNGEQIHDVHDAPAYKSIHFSTGSNEYIYYPEDNKLFIAIEKHVIEYEQVLYPNRAVETKFEGM